MSTIKLSRFFIDNATVAGAGRALYDDNPDHSDCISLMHMVMAALLCDEIYLDGSSRFIQVPIYDAYQGKHKVTEPAAAIWTWEKKYPGIGRLCPIVDGFWQRVMGFDETRIIEFLISVLSSDGAQFLDDMNIDLIPSIYASADYFDTDWIQEKLSLVRETTNFHFTENNFRMLLYAWRGIYYHEVGKQTGITYLPNPQRNLFIEKLMIPGKALFDSGSKAVSFIAKTIADPRFQLIQKLARNKEREFAINLSPFFSYVLNQCSTSRMEIVDQVRQLRDRKDFRQLRKIISRYDQAYQDENLLDLHELTKEIEKSMKNFNKRHGLENVAVSVFPKLPFGLLEIKGTDELLKYPISKIFFKEIFQKPYLALMWDISKNLMKRGFGLEQLCKLQPLKQEEPHPVEWILMEQSQCVKFKGDPMATDLAKGEFYITGDVAAVCNYQQFGFQNYNQMMKASGRPAQQARTICDDDD